MTVLYPTRIKKNNLGDILINVLLVRELSKHCFVLFDDRPDSAFLKLLIHQNPYSDRIMYPAKRSLFKGLPVLRWISVIQMGRKIDMVFDPPGHYFGTDSFKALLKGLKNIPRAWVLRLMNSRAVRMGVTMGPYGNRGWQLQKYIARFYYATGVRDHVNYEALQKIKWPNLQYFDDLSFLYNDKLIDEDNGMELPVKGNYLLLSFRNNIEGHRIDKEYFDRVIDALKIGVSQLIQPGWNILITHQVEEDLEASLAIQQMLSSIGIEATVIKKQLDLTLACRLYKEAELVLTNRLHVALLALLNNTAAYALTDVGRHPKLSNLYRDLKLESLLMDVNEPGEWMTDHSKLNALLNQFARVKQTRQYKMQEQLISLLHQKSGEPVLH